MLASQKDWVFRRTWMLIRCPRCGFEQPKDRFCANCGVDTENFRPERRGRAKDSNSAFYYFLAVVVFSATAWFLYQRSLEPTESGRIRNKSTTFEKMGLNANEKPESPESPETEVVPLPVTPSPAAAATAAPTPPIPGTPSPLRFVVYFAEVPSDTMRDIVEDRNTRPESDHWIVGAFRSSVLQKPAVRLLDTPESRSVSNFEEPIQIFSGSRDPKQKEALGLFINVLPLSSENRIFQIKVEIRKVLRGAQNDTTETQTLTRELAIPEGGGALIGGLLARGRKPTEAEEAIYQSSFLKILSSDLFQSGGSDFMLFIEATSMGNP